jgi:hypothetical protein
MLGLHILVQSSFSLDKSQTYSNSDFAIVTDKDMQKCKLGSGSLKSQENLANSLKQRPILS